MAAAFERARAALDRTPPLSSTVERVLRRCGSRADLLLETVQSCSLYAKPLDIFTNARLDGQRMSQGCALMGRPLLTALQQGDASCPHCSPLGRLLIKSVSRSGSSLEGFIPTVSRGGKNTTSSDLDYMLQLGPVLWEETDAVCGGSQETAAESRAVGSATGADSGQEDDEAVPRLRVAPTENPGFVLLYEVTKKKCAHPDEHLFSADSVRLFIHQFFQAREKGNNELTSSGPATSFGQQHLRFDGFDMVPCLLANWWPSEEFFRRSRAQDWPPRMARDDIRQFGIHLVPVGAKGSSTELHEFRLSFSRPEVIAAWHLLPAQRNSQVALKACKTALGPEGKPVKSYYMKTALFWLCQNSDVKLWTSVKQGMHMIIDFLEKAIDAQYLGCFFWSEINLFRQSSLAELAAMRYALGLLRRNMTRLLAHELSGDIENTMATIILQEPFQQLSERQLRVCLARKHVFDAIMYGLMRIMSLRIDRRRALRVQMFLLASAETELACVNHDKLQQNCLFLALTVAPADVMVQCRLTSLNDVMLSWDAAPLVELLTPQDLRSLLGDPSAVHAWLKDQRRLPTGLSSPRTLADLLLNPSLLAEALRESVPWWWEFIQGTTREFHVTDDLQTVSADSLMSFDDARRQEMEIVDSSNTLAVFERLPRHGGQSGLCQYRQFREKARQFLDDPQTRAEFDRNRRRLPDPWRLRQFVFTDS